MEESIVFFGTGPVAAKSLKLLTEEFRIEAVVTKPRAAHHRGEVPVLELAEQLELPVIEVSNKQEVSEKVAAANLTSRAAVLIDFGIIVEQKTIDLFPLGIVNSHFSLLPEWRGADPITFSLLSGQTQTGISLMLLVEAMDEGPLLAQTTYDIEPDTTTPELTADLIALSDITLKRVLPLYLADKIAPAAQEQASIVAGEPASYSRKLTKEDGILDWNKPAVQLEREIRAYADWPKSRCVLGGHAVIVTKARAEAGEGIPGTVWNKDRSLGVYTTKGILMLERVKPAGKGEMPIAAFLNGYSKDL